MALCNEKGALRPPFFQISLLDAFSHKFDPFDEIELFCICLLSAVLPFFDPLLDPLN